MSWNVEEERKDNDIDVNGSLSILSERGSAINDLRNSFYEARYTGPLFAIIFCTLAYAIAIIPRNDKPWMFERNAASKVPVDLVSSSVCLDY